MSNETGRLKYTVGYKRPEITITESIQTKDDIEEQLKGFELINNDDLEYVTLHTPLKYITYDKTKKKEMFRFGGTLAKIEREYVVLAGKQGLRFSVQRYTKDDKGKIIHTTKFYKKQTKFDTEKTKYENVIIKTHKLLDEQNSQLMDKEYQLKEQQKQIEELKKQCKLLKKSHKTK